MAYIAPNSTIRICKGVPLNNDYKHSIAFPSLAAQASYFASKTQVTLSDQSYQRVVKGKMRVQVRADSIYDCNYLAFQNTSFGSKWFYAFITGIEYVSNDVSEITFEIDSLQTYLFDMSFEDCYIERQHTLTDEIGENIEPEPIEIPKLCVYDVHTKYWSADDYYVEVQLKPNLLAEITGNQLFKYEENQVKPFSLFFSKTEILNDELNSQLKAMEAQGFEIVNAYMYPYQIKASVAEDIDTTLMGLYTPTSFKGYNQHESDYTQIKNNKLFTFPFVKLLVASTQGSSAEYKWEDFTTRIPRFKLYGVAGNNPSCELRPYNYFNSSDVRLDTVDMDEFPIVNLAQHTSINALNLLSSVITLAGSLMTKTTPLGIANIGKTALDIASDTGKNNVGTTHSNLDLKFSTMGFIFYRMALRASDARRIDDFFSTYGYAINRVQQPNITARPHWTYIKTRNIILKCGAPVDDVKRICNIFDNGITWWRRAEEVGDYSLDNSNN